MNLGFMVRAKPLSQIAPVGISPMRGPCNLQFCGASRRNDVMRLTPIQSASPFNQTEPVACGLPVPPEPAVGCQKPGEGCRLRHHILRCKESLFCAPSHRPGMGEMITQKPNRESASRALFKLHIIKMIEENNRCARPRAFPATHHSSTRLSIGVPACFRDVTNITELDPNKK